MSNVCGQDISAQQLPQPFQQQSPAATEDDPVDPCDDPIFNPYCPIDSYLYILLGIGVVYGLKKVNDQKKLQRIKDHSSSSENLV